MKRPVRNPLVSFLFAAALVLGALFLLPVLGVLFLVVVAVLVLAVAAFLAAPWLARLPWFRDRIHVEQTPFGQAIRFGRERGYRDPHAGQGPRYNAGTGDVIDVEGRELPDRED